jgi:hypothetical protein
MRNDAFAVMVWRVTKCGQSRRYWIEGTNWHVRSGALFQCSINHFSAESTGELLQSREMAHGGNFAETSTEYICLVILWLASVEFLYDLFGMPKGRVSDGRRRGASAFGRCRFGALRRI